MMKQKKSTLILSALLALVLILSSIAYHSLRRGKAPMLDLAQTSEPAKSQPLPLPSFDLLDSAGDTISSTELVGKPTILNFWATWCGFCVEEMPDFQTAYETYGNQVNFAMINVTDGARETKALADAFVSAHKFTFPIYYDTTLAGVTSFGLTGYPTTVFVSAEGEVLLVFPGRISSEQLTQGLESMLST